MQQLKTIEAVVPPPDTIFPLPLPSLLSQRLQDPQTQNTVALTVLLMSVHVENTSTQKSRQSVNVII